MSNLEEFFYVKNILPNRFVSLPSKYLNWRKMTIDRVTSDVIDQAGQLDEAIYDVAEIRTS